MAKHNNTLSAAHQSLGSWKYTKVLAEARALNQEHNQYGKRQPKPVQVKVIRRRQGQDTVVLNLIAG